MRELLLKFKLNIFEGPLDLLLYLVRKNEFDIFDIPIAEITSQYLEYLKILEEIGIEILSDYMAMAALLMEIKSRMLIPILRGEKGELKEEDPRRELVHMLLLYEKFKNLGEYLNSLPMLERDEFLPAVQESKEDVRLEDISPYELRRIYAELLMRNVPVSVKVEEIDIMEKIRELTELIKKMKKISFFQLTEGKTITQITALFLALLTLAKNGLCNTYQEKIFSDIIVSLKEMKDGEKPQAYN